MTALLTWRVLRVALPLALIAALVVALLLTRATNARHVAELAATTRALTASNDSIVELETRVHDQNAAVDALATRSEAAGKAAVVAAAVVAERDKALAGAMVKLDASAAVTHVAGEPCTISPALMMIEGEL